MPKEKIQAIRNVPEQQRPVVMTGDGVNDAPAIKLANVGIGMGRGILMTDITLTKNNFGKPEIVLNNNSKNFISQYYNVDYNKIHFIVSVTDEKSLINTAVIIDYDKF